MAGNETKKPIGHVELFVDEAKKTKEQLTNGFTRLCILSIVGMPGIGKTTLGNSIYENPLVPLCFDAHARFHVSRVYEKRRLLLEILQQVCGKTDQVWTMEDEDLAQMLYQSLEGKKYFFFLDDLWDIRPWNDSKAYFLDDNSGSRIMFTSRLQNIASETGFKSVIYQLVGPGLLQVKLFGKQVTLKNLSMLGGKLQQNAKA